MSSLSDLPNRVAARAARCQNSAQVHVALTEFARLGPTKLGQFSRTLAENFNSTLDTQSGSESLLPFPVAAAELQFVEWNRDRVGPDAEGCVAVCVGVLLALNFYACAGFATPPVDAKTPQSFTSSQRQACWKMFNDCSNYLAVPALPFSLREERSELLHRKISYHGEVISVRRQLEAELVIPTWPKVGEACVCPIVDHIDGHLRDDLLDPWRCILPQSLWPAETPRSKVHATDAEWYKLCKAAGERGMFEPVDDADVFKNQHGDQVLNGAMGVDKYKDIDGVPTLLERFICNLVPINLYMRKLMGDSWLLPQVNQIGSMVLGEGEYVWTNADDITSAFNVFHLPACWKGFFAFNKRVSRGAFGGPSDETTLVAMTAVPMGWQPSVDILQNFMRRFVFGVCGVPASLEMRKDQPLPTDDIMVVCIDGADLVSKLKVVNGALDVAGWSAGGNSDERTPVFANFVDQCRRRNLPLNEGKKVVREYNVLILGGELDGIRGSLMHSRVKGHQLASRTLALLSLDVVPQVALQHWAGRFCFAASFLRSLFSIPQEIFPAICRYETDGFHLAPLSEAVMDEILVGALLLPMAQTNLRAQVRTTMSMSDASEQGGSSAEAVCFRPHLDPIRARAAEDLELAKLDRVAQGPSAQPCRQCKATDRGQNAGCPRACGESFCSVSCVQQHRTTCSHKAVARQAVIVPPAGMLQPIRLGLVRSEFDVLDSRCPGVVEEIAFTWIHLPGFNACGPANAQLLRQSGKLVPMQRAGFQAGKAAKAIRDVMTALRFFESLINGAYPYDRKPV